MCYRLAAPVRSREIKKGENAFSPVPPGHARELNLTMAELSVFTPWANNHSRRLAETGPIRRPGGRLHSDGPCSSSCSNSSDVSG
jgi:hypothetical protein